MRSRFSALRLLRRRRCPQHEVAGVEIFQPLALDAGFGVDQLRGDAARLPNLRRASEHIAHAQLAADPLYIDSLAFVGEPRTAGDHEEPEDTGQAGNDVLDHAVGAHALER